LIKLKFSKNKKGEYRDPMTLKEFNEITHIIAIKTSGNVYSNETLEEMNFSLDLYEDLISGKKILIKIKGEKFTKKDLITIQDPKNKKKINLADFHHVANKLSVNLEFDKKINVSKDQEKIMETIKKEEKVNEEKNKILYESTPMGNNSKSSSFTSSTMSIITNENKTNDEEIKRNVLYKKIKKKNKHAYVTLHTSEGDMVMLLYSSKIPKTCDNFIQLCETDYYNNTIFHRLIKNFMVQGLLSNNKRRRSNRHRNRRGEHLEEKV
jgi:peptidyl-prolyl cis-trans isomerase-like 2